METHGLDVVDDFAVMTINFLRVFGLNSLSELPEIHLPMKPKEGELKEASDQVEIAAVEDADTPAENE